MHIPKHIAIIMDGNGRWAKRRGLPRVEGHRVGGEVAINVIKHCKRIGVEQLTLFALSQENWKRPKEEIDALMQILKVTLIENRELLTQEHMQFRMIGRRDGIPEDVLQEADENTRLTLGNTGMMLCLAVNYGGRAEIVDAVRSVAREAIRDNWTEKDVNERVSEIEVADRMYTAGMPDPDLLIRTAGEMRISNFLLWQLYYAELWVTETCWPDFSPQLLDEAIQTFATRNRKFGGLGTRG